MCRLHPAELLASQAHAMKVSEITNQLEVGVPQLKGNCCCQVNNRKGRGSVACLGTVTTVGDLSIITWDDGKAQQVSLGELDQLLLRSGSLVGCAIKPVSNYST